MTISSLVNWSLQVSGCLLHATVEALYKIEKSCVLFLSTLPTFEPCWRITNFVIYNDFLYIRGLRYGVYKITRRQGTRTNTTWFLQASGKLYCCFQVYHVMMEHSKHFVLAANVDIGVAQIKTTKLTQYYLNSVPLPALRKHQSSNVPYIQDIKWWHQRLGLVPGETSKLDENVTWLLFKQGNILNTVQERIASFIHGVIVVYGDLNLIFQNAVALDYFLTGINKRETGDWFNQLHVN